MNRLRGLLDQRTTAVGIMVQQLREPIVVHACADAGFDFVVIDMEHGTYRIDEVERLSSLCRLRDITPIVRVADHHYASIARALDAGACGIMAPRVTCADDVAALVDAMKYPPIGNRGFASLLAQSNYQRPVERLRFAHDINDSTVLIAQIEDSRAIGAIDEILGQPGLDVAMIGPSDLELSLTYAPGSLSVDGAIDHILHASLSHRPTVGIQHTDPAAITEWHKRGMRFFVAGTESALLASTLSRHAEAFRAAIQDH